MFAGGGRLILQIMTTLSRSLPLALLLSGLCAVPAMARDRHHKHHRHHHRPSVSFGFYGGGAYPFGPAPYYSPYYHAPSVVYVEPRPVYVERARQSVEYDVQSELARKGYYGGVIDGVIGSQTRAAIRTYQVDRGIPVTGRIDGALLRSLRLI